MDMRTPRSQRLEALMAALDIEELGGFNEPLPDDRSEAILQLSARELLLRGVALEAFISAWNAEFNPNFAEYEARFSSYFHEVFKERTSNLSQLLLRKHRKGEEPVALNELANEIMPPDVKEATRRTTANRLINETHEPMSMTNLWTIKINFRTVKGVETPASYEISAGPALVDWNDVLFEPYRMRQIAEFWEKFGKGEDE